MSVLLFGVLFKRFWAKYFHKNLAIPALEKAFADTGGDLKMPLTCVILHFLLYFTNFKLSC